MFEGQRAACTLLGAHGVLEKLQVSGCPFPQRVGEPGARQKRSRARDGSGTAPPGSSRQSRGSRVAAERLRVALWKQLG